MISRTFQMSVAGTPKEFPSYDDFCDGIEKMIGTALPHWHATVTDAYAATDAEGERSLTFHLYKFLDLMAREEAVPWTFAHEHPQRGSRSEDVTVTPGSRDGIRIEQVFFGLHQRLYTIEAKRLPTPKDPQKDRTREYVCGHWDRAADAKKPISGGIERFKENKHGDGLRRGGMVAFIQAQTPQHWLGEVNGWVGDLAATPCPCPVLQSSWSGQDQLRLTSRGSAIHSEYISVHDRAAGAGQIGLRHFWIDLTGRPAQDDAGNIGGR